MNETAVRMRMGRLVAGMDKLAAHHGEYVIQFGQTAPVDRPGTVLVSLK
jgi:hypothetical protein